MVKTTPLWLMVVFLLGVSLASAQSEDIDSDAQVVSSFLVELIDKYDVSGMHVTI
jgi:hypothetical protein